MFLFFDARYLLFALPGLVIALAAQAYVSSSFRRFARVASRSGLAGRDAAQLVLRSAGLEDVAIEPVEGELTDHFDPRKGVIRLSRPVYAANSLAALGVAAHEAGHAVQHARGYLPARLRSAIVPVASLGSSLALPVFFVGMVLSSRAVPLGGALQHLAILLFAGVALFQIVTLPVEFNASRRALRALAGTGALAEDELPGARRVLTAAALTYVAALLQTLLVLLYLIMASRRR